ncbi:hypothetical protein C8A01DRAFT_40488, partial [Parachaetomium inaequale]
MALLLPGLLYALILLALTGIAIYEHITITTLSLPVSPALTILTILLPLLAPIATFSTPALFKSNPPNNTRTLANARNGTHKRHPLPNILTTPLLPTL